MTMLTGGFLFAAVLLYLASGFLASMYIVRMDNSRARLAMRLAVAGAVVLIVRLVLVWVARGQAPLASGGERFDLFVVLATAVAMGIERSERMQSVLCFYLPPLAGICLANAVLGGRGAGPDTPPYQLQDGPLIVHVGLLSLSYALFFAAAVTSALYVFQAHNLKRRHKNVLFQRFPSLERLDQTLYRLVRVAYPLFVVTLGVGLLWAILNPELLGSRWWTSPKILLSVCMLVFYAAGFHARKLGWLSGPKFAYFVFVGFLCLLTASLVLGLTHLTNHNFWGPVS